MGLRHYKDYLNLPLQIVIDHRRQRDRYTDAIFDGLAPMYIGSICSRYLPVDLYLDAEASTVYSKYSNSIKDYQKAQLGSKESRGCVAELFVAARIVHQMLSEASNKNQFIVGQIKHEVNESILLEVHESDRHKISLPRSYGGSRCYLGSTLTRGVRADLYYTPADFSYVQEFYIQYPDNHTYCFGDTRPQFAEAWLALQIIQVQKQQLSPLKKFGDFLKNL